MASSSTEICNLALSHLGVGVEIASLTERSEEARACNTFYEQARDEMLRAFPWPFATVIATLSLVEEDPTDEWGFSYRYPSNCLMVRRLLSGIRHDTRQSRANYVIGSDEDGLLIYSDLDDDPQVEYTARFETVLRFPPDFVMALSYRIAAYLAPRLTAGDPFKKADMAMKLFMMSQGVAQSAAFNEQVVGEDAESEYVRARE